MKKTFPIDPLIPSITKSIINGVSILLTANTGSGKTIILPYHLSKFFRVLVLVPRVVLTTESVNSVKAIFGEDAIVGSINGRLKNPSGRLDYATYGSALANKKLLEKYDVVIIDEYHERSIDQDIALNIVEKLYKVGKIKSFIISTATIGTEKIVKRYNTKHYHSDGRMYDVLTESISEYEIYQYLKDNMHRKGAIICNGKEAIEKICVVHKHAFPYHAEMEDEDLSISLTSNLIVGTNILRTGLNIEGLDFVIDFLQVNEMKYINGISNLICRTATIAESNQAKGRVGRMKKGEYLMVGQPLGDYPEPEILKVPVLNGYLNLLKFGYTPNEFEWLDTPNWDEAILKSTENKFSIDNHITDLGLDFLAYNLPVNCFLMVKEAEIVGCLEQTLLAVAIMNSSKRMIAHKSSIQSVFNHKDLRVIVNPQSEIIDNIILYNWMSDNINNPTENEFVKENLFKGAFFEIKKIFKKISLLYNVDEIKYLSYEKDEIEFKNILYKFSNRKGNLENGRRGRIWIESNTDYYSTDFKKSRVDKSLKVGFTQVNLFDKEMATWVTTI